MTESAKRLKNYFDYEEWENESYDQLLIHLYRKFNSDELKKIIEKETSKLQFVSTEQLNTILDAFGDMSIFQSKLDLPIMRDRIYCQLVFPHNLKETNIPKHIKKELKIEPFEEMIDEIFNVLLFNEVLKIHYNEKFKIILEKNLN